MKVLYIASATGMTGGATKSLISILCQMQAHGIDIEVACPDEHGLTRWLREKRIKVHVVPFRHARLPVFDTIPDILKWIPRAIYYHWINLRGRAAMKRIVKESSPDIIHENSSVINVGYHAARQFGVPDVIHIREYGDLDFNMKLPGRKKRLKGENVYTIPITQGISRHLRQDINPRAYQIYDGIVQEHEFRFTENKQRWFLFASRIEPAKGIEDLLEAYAEYAGMTSDPFPLRVCGGGHEAYLQKLKALVEEKGIRENVVWCGEREDIADFMANTAATIIPSRNEGLGRVMPEAMANGSLCVAKNASGTREQLENGLKLTGNPIAIAYEDKEQLIEALLLITGEMKKGNAFAPESKFRKIIERSQIAVREFFSEESFGDKLHEFYRKILQDRKKH